MEKVPRTLCSFEFLIVTRMARYYNAVRSVVEHILVAIRRTSTFDAAGSLELSTLFRIMT